MKIYQVKKLTDNNLVKEEDISNVVPTINNNNDEEWATW